PAHRNVGRAGGVALSGVANGKILAEGILENIWVQPAAGDAGGSVGAALAAYSLHAGRQRVIASNEIDGMQGAYLGPAYDQTQIENELTAGGARFVTLAEHDAIDRQGDTLSGVKGVRLI